MFAKRSVSCVSVFAAASAVALFGCNSPKSPPSIPVPAVTPVSVPQPAAPKDAELFGYLKLRDPAQLIQMLAGPTAPMMAQAQGIDLAELKAGQPATVFVWDPQGASMANMPVAALLPVPAAGTFVKKITSSVPVAQAAAQGDAATMVALSPGAQQHAAAQTAALVEIAGAKLPFDGVLYLHAAPIMAKYGPVLRNALKTFEPMMAAAALKQPGSPSPAATSAMFEGMISGLEALRSITIGAEMKDGVDLSVLVEDKTAAGPGGPIAAADLVQFLPPGDVRMQWNVRDLRRMIDSYLKVYGGMLKDNAEVNKAVMPLIDEWAKASPRSDTAITMAFASDKGFRFQGIMKVEDGKRVFELMRKTTGVFSVGAVHDAYKKMGIDLAITGTQNVRKVRGWPVDRYVYKFEASGPNVLPAQKAIYDKFNGATYEVAQIGPYMVYAMNGSLEEVVESLFSGTGKYPLTATKLYPAGGTLYMDVDVANLVSALRTWVPAGQADKLPVIPAGSGMLTVWSYDGGATSYARIGVPKTLIGAIMAAKK